MAESPEVAFKIFGSRVSESKKLWSQDLKKSQESMEKSQMGRESRKDQEKNQSNFEWFEKDNTRSKSCLGGFKNVEDF